MKRRTDNSDEATQQASRDADNPRSLECDTGRVEPTTGLNFRKVRAYCQEPSSPAEAVQVRKIGEYIRVLRQKGGLSRIQLAQDLGVELELVATAEAGFAGIDDARNLLAAVRKRVGV